MANRWLPFLFPKPVAPAAPKPRGGPRAQVITVVAGGREVEVTLRRNARAKRYTLRLSPKGVGATVTLPRRGTIAEARAFLSRHLDWIAERLPSEGAATAAPGGSLLYRGIPHRIAASGGLRGVVRAAHADDGPVLLVPGEPEHAARKLATFLRKAARTDLEAAVARHAATLGVRPSAIRLKDTTSRWGSASSRGVLCFSWRLVLAPPFVLDYVAAHEVAHLREMNHSDRFWSICRALAPRTDEAKNWLKMHGSDLHRAI